MNKIIFVSVHPIHYNDFLFHEIAHAGFDVSVYYSNKSLKNYPWKQKMNYSFPAKDCEYKYGIDWALLKKAAFEKNTLFIIAGWESMFKNLLFLTLMLFGKKYILWTDTIKVNVKRSPAKAFLREKWLKLLLGRAFKIFTTGEIGVKEMKKLYASDDRKIINFPFATDLNFFKTKPDFSKYEQEKIILSSGRLLNFHKGHDLAIRSMAELKQLGYKFKYLIAGTGPDEAMLKNLISELDVEKEVILLGWQELGDLVNLYATSNILLHPSHFDPFPNAILESMASGLVVVASDKAGSAMERVEHNKSGFIFPDNDQQALTNTLVKLFNLSSAEMAMISGEAIKVSQKWNVNYNTGVIKTVTQ